MKWVASRKAKLIRAIEDGDMTDMDAFIAYGITTQELNEWRKRYTEHGLAGLRVTHVARYRKKDVII